MKFCDKTAILHFVLLIGIMSIPTIATVEIIDKQNFKTSTRFINKEFQQTELPILLESTQFELPEVITWSVPNGATQHHRVLDGTIRPAIATSAGVWCQTTPFNCCQLECNCYQRTPQSVVNKLAYLYSIYGDLYGLSPAILLQELGMGDGDPCPQAGTVQHWMYADALFLNWCDQIKPDVNDPCSPPTHESARWLSPWNDNGIDFLKSWMTTFLNEYQSKVANGSLPIPGRFVFDTEYWPMAPYWGENGIVAFRDLAGLNEGELPDDRWDTKVLPIYEKTLKQLYDEAIVSGMTPPVPGHWSIEENHSWVVWYDGVMVTLCDYAMKKAFFDPIKEVWPEVISSNFDTSISTDGLQSIPGSPFRVFRNRRHQSASWFELVQQGSSDEQAAEMYPVSELHLQQGEDPGLAWSRVHRANVEACTESYDGYSIDKIMPWIPLINTPFVTGWFGEIEYPDKWSVRNLIAMFRSKGIKKFFVWSVTQSENIQNWSEFDDLIDQVWLTKLSSYAVNIGDSEEGAISKLLNADWNWKEIYTDDVLSISSVDHVSEQGVECEFHFETDFNCTQTREMQLMVDARIEGDLIELGAEAELEFFMQNASTGDWLRIENEVVDIMWFDVNQDKWVWEVDVDSTAIPIDQRRVVLHIPIKLSRYWISDIGEVNIRFAGRSSDQFTILLDSVTLFETDELRYSDNCLADCAPEGGDGIVDIVDLLFVISAYNNSGIDLADVYPACGDGQVNIDDLLQIIVNWQQDCN